MRSVPKSRLWKLETSLFVLLAGGSVFTSCDTRFRQIVVGGTKNYVQTLLDPAAIVELLFSDPAEDDGETVTE